MLHQGLRRTHSLSLMLFDELFMFFWKCAFIICIVGSQTFEMGVQYFTFDLWVNVPIWRRSPPAVLLMHGVKRRPCPINCILHINYIYFSLFFLLFINIVFIPWSLSSLRGQLEFPQRVLAVQSLWVLTYVVHLKSVRLGLLKNSILHLPVLLELRLPLFILLLESLHKRFYQFVLPAFN